MLNVNEIFGPTIQGEGMSAGKPCMFLRVSGCNLHCNFCDTPYTWNWVGTSFPHPEKYEREKEEHAISDDQIIETLEASSGEVRRVVISGGEPIAQQKRLIPIVAKLKKKGWIIEVETNGTVPPIEAFSAHIDQFNVSPKLENSGNKKEHRHRPNALRALVETGKAHFKFVVGSKEDMEEVLDLAHEIRLWGDPPLMLMPLGKTKEELALSTPLVERLSYDYGFLPTRRLHIEDLGGGRGV